MKLEHRFSVPAPVEEAWLVPAIVTVLLRDEDSATRVGVVTRPHRQLRPSR
jgi:hypothetical protein